MTERHRLDPPPVQSLSEHPAAELPGHHTAARTFRIKDRSHVPGAAAEPMPNHWDDPAVGQRRHESRLLLPPLGLVAAPAAILLAAGIAASAALFWDSPDEPPTGASGARPQAVAARSTADLRGLGWTLIEPGDRAWRQAQPDGAPRPQYRRPQYAPPEALGPEASSLEDSRPESLPIEDAPPPSLTDVPTPAAAPPSLAAALVDPEPISDRGPGGGPDPAGPARADGDAPWPEASGGAGEDEDEAARLDHEVRPVIEDLLANPPAAGMSEPSAPAPHDGQTRDNDYPESAATMISVPPPATGVVARPAPHAHSGPAAREPDVAQLGAPEVRAAPRGAVEPRAAEPIAGAPRVFVHYSTRLERGREIAAAAVRHLEAVGYQVADIRTVGFGVATARVRYFFDGDRAAAQRLTADLGTYLATAGPGQAPVLQNYTTFKPLPSPGNIEVWIPSGGGS